MLEVDALGLRPVVGAAHTVFSRELVNCLSMVGNDSPGVVYVNEI